jgi:hypothetical protein
MHPILHYRNDDGTIVQIGPEHPDYQQLLAEYRAANPNAPLHPTFNRWEMVKVGALCALGGAAALWWEYTRMRDAQRYSIKLEICGGFLVVLGVCGLLASLAPARWHVAPAGGMTKTQQTLLILLCLATLGGGGLLTYLFHQWALNQLGLE